MNRFLAIFCATVMGMTMAAQPSQAQKISPQVMTHARTVAINCVGQWRTASCIQAMGKSNKDLVINYATALNAKGAKAALDILKQGCAASTVAEKNNMPSKAFASAYNECSNTIYDLTNRTNTLPDQSHYQLLVAGALCMDGDSRCGDFEVQMKNWIK